MSIKVAELTTDELKFLMRDTIEEKMAEMFIDPDEGLKLKEDVKEKLKISLDAVRQGKRGLSGSEVAKRIGVSW
ncbi:hypothetical protein KKG61_02430 [bacterium]|nr:hypothetical protein [bacterium]